MSDIMNARERETERQRELVEFSWSFLIVLLGAKVDFYQFDQPHCAADVLKLWLRSLPEPLVTARLFPRFMAVSSLQNEKYQVRFDLLRDLLTHTYFITGFQCRFIILLH
jgi:hypothetical protein